MYGGDHRLGAGLHGGLDVTEVGPLRWFAELADVGPGDEGPAATRQHDGGDRVIVPGRFDTVEDALADMVAQGVDRWIVDDDEGDIAVAFEADRLREFRHGQRL